MELAIAIQAIEDIGLLEQPWTHSRLTELERENCQAFQKALSETIGETLPGRVYFGSEFCQYRLYTGEELISAYEIAKQSGYNFSIVVPYLPQMRIQQFYSILLDFRTFLHQSSTNKKVEIICNDWGTLQLVKSEFPKNFTIVLGRLMNKMVRDPRTTQYYNREVAPTLANTHFKQGSYSVDEYRETLKEFGVQMIEFDNFYQGVQYDYLDRDLKVATHFNYGSVATGRACLVGTLHLQKSEKFRGHQVCKQQCRHYTAELVNQHPMIETMQQRVVQKGNSVFYVQTFEQMKIGLEHAYQNKIDRIIFSPKIPV
ncbi:hypothetical protein ACNQFZ_00395 [Schinkia sp. CFF1]